MFNEGRAKFEHEFNTTEGVTERMIADFVIAHEPEPRLTADFDFMIQRGTFKKYFHDLFPYFEKECARTGAPDLKEIRRMTHYLDKRTGIQTDLPDATIVGELNYLASQELIDNRRRVLGKESSEIYQAAMEEIDDFQTNRHIEPVLHRIELAIVDLDQKIETAIRVASRDEREVKRLEKNRQDIATLRAARSTLLEQYLSPDSMH